MYIFNRSPLLHNQGEEGGGGEGKIYGEVQRPFFAFEISDMGLFWG